MQHFVMNPVNKNKIKKPYPYIEARGFVILYFNCNKVSGSMTDLNVIAWLKHSQTK